MEWPSGDQRGENIPTDPGSVVTWLPSSSRMQITLFGSSPASLLVEKTIFRPSGDQFAISLRSDFSWEKQPWSAALG